MSNETTVQCAFRFPESLVKALDAYAEKLTKAQPGMLFTRADAVRMLLTRALAAEAPRRRGRSK